MSSSTSSAPVVEVSCIKPQLRVALFDLDGTLCNSDTLHYEAWRDELADLELSAASASTSTSTSSSKSTNQLTLEEYNRCISGRANALIAADYFPHFTTEQREAFCITKEARFRALAVGENALSPLSGLLSLLSDMRANGFMIACVTNAPRVNAEFMLTQIGLSWNDSSSGSSSSSRSDKKNGNFKFDCLVVGDECSASKPSPAPYLEAMRRLTLLQSQAEPLSEHIQPDICCVFEDSPSGITSGLAANASLVIGLCTTHSVDKLVQSCGAHVAVSDYTSMSVASLRQIHAQLQYSGTCTDAGMC